MRRILLLAPLLLAGCDVAPTLVLNEFMASNTVTLTDSEGGTPDWIEVHNNGDSAISLAGFSLSDDSTLLDRGPLPLDVELEAGGYALFFCERDVVGDPQVLPFRLSAGGEEVLLSYDFGDGPEVVQSLTYGAQISDVSMARMPDGDGEWTEDTTPTPDAANE